MFYIDRYPELVPPIIVFLVAFFLSLHATALLRILSPRLGVMDHPGRRKPQATAIPCTGGLAIVLGVTVALLLTYGRSPDIQIIIYVGLGIALVGLLDDVFSVRAVVKLAALAAGCLVLFANGIGLNRTPFDWLNYLLTFLWVAGVSSAFNAIDNSDGLAGSICVIASVSTFLLGWSSWQLSFSFLAMSLAGASLGFLHHNIKPARIYLGDSGSFFLGYILAVLVIFGEWSENPTVAFLSGGLVLALPIYDLGMTTLLRIKHGIVHNVLEAIAYSDRDHLSHRLLALGLSHGAMIAVLCAIGLVCSGTALLIARANTPVAIAATAVLAVALLAFGLYLDRKT